MHLWVARQQRSGGNLGLIELARLHQIDDGVGGSVQRILEGALAPEPGDEVGLELTRTLTTLGIALVAGRLSRGHQLLLGRLVGR